MQLNDALRWFIYLGIFAIPFIVFWVFGGLFFPFITSKAFVFHVLVELILLAWVILALRDPYYRPRISGISLAVLAFILAITLASAFGEDFSQSFWSNYERMMGIFGYLHFAIFFLAIGSVFKSWRIWHAFFATTLGISIVVALQGFSEIGTTSRIDAELGNPIYLAGYALLNIFLAAFAFVNARRHLAIPWLPWFYAFAGLLNLVAMYFTGTRGTILGLFGGVFLACAMIALFERGSGRKERTLRKVTIGICAVFVLVPIVFWGVKDTTFVQNNTTLDRFSEISLEEGTGGARIDLWEMSWYGFLDRPIFGYGLENFDVVFAQYYQAELYDEESWFDRAHSVVFNWLVLSGVVGLVAYLLIFAAFVLSLWQPSFVRRRVSQMFPSQERGLWQKLKDTFSGRENGEFTVTEKSILTGLAAGYFAHGLFVFEDTVTFTIFFAVVAFVHSRISASRPPLFGTKPAKVTTRGIVGGLTALLIVFILYFGTYLPLRQNMALIDALRAPSAEQQIDLFRQALAYDTFGNIETREQLVLESRKLPGGTNQQILQQYFSLAASEIQKTIEARPNATRGYFFQAILRARFGQSDQALSSINQALELAPNKQQFLNLKAEILSSMEGKEQELLSVARRMHELTPASDTSARLYARALIRNDRSQQASELLREHFGEDYVPKNEIVDAYAQAESYDRLVDIWQIKVEQNPTDIQTRFSLAYAYYKNGENEQAIQTLETIKEKWPRTAEQVDRSVADIRAGRDPGQSSE